jgi:hypothetical protein
MKLNNNKLHIEEVYLFVPGKIMFISICAVFAVHVKFEVTSGLYNFQIYFHNPENFLVCSKLASKENWRGIFHVKTHVQYFMFD